MRRVEKFPEVMEIEAYVYTAGPIGAKWLEALRSRRLTAAYCPNCKRLFLPPKLYCPRCFGEVSELKDIEPVGVVESFTVVTRDFHGQPLREPVALAFIKFPGVDGGLIHYVKAQGLEIGMRVRPKWREERKGLVTDIEYFERA